MFTQVKQVSRLYCLILFSLLFSLSAFASAENVSEYKGCSVKGKVIDALTAQPVEYATVALFKSGEVKLKPQSRNLNEETVTAESKRLSIKLTEEW